MAINNLKNLEFNNRKLWKEKELDFVSEINKNNEQWSKDRRTDFLRKEINNINNEIKELNFLSEKCVGEIYQWFGEYIKENFITGMNNKKNKFLKNLKFIDCINDDNNINQKDIDVAREYRCSDIVEVQKRENGRSWCACVFHNEKTPSMCIYEKSNSFYCFGCGKSGDSIDLAMFVFNLDFVNVVRKLSHIC